MTLAGLASQNLKLAMDHSLETPTTLNQEVVFSVLISKMWQVPESEQTAIIEFLNAIEKIVA